MNKRKITITGILFYVIVSLLDYIFKQFILNKNITVIPNVLSLNYTENISLTTSTIIINSLLMCLVIGLIVYFTKKENKVAIPLYIILSGGIGNLLDKFIRGYVIDYIKIFNSSAINLSDIAITIGIITFVIFWLINLIKLKKTSD